LDKGKAIPYQLQAQGYLSSVSKADGFVILPENVEGFIAGEEVEMVLIE
jgi:molybdopterin molybdotransferase